MTLDRSLLTPWAADTPELLTEPLTHLAAADVLLPSGETVPVTLLECTVSFDETTAPRVSANVTAELPGDQALLDRIDPRTGARLLVAAGYLRPDDLEDVHQLCDLGLRTRRVNRDEAAPDGTMTLAALGDEALLVDNAPSNGGSVSTANTVDAIKAVVAMVLPGATVNTAVTSSGPGITEAPLGDKWTRVQDWSDSIDAQTYDDGTRTWWVRTQPTLGAVAADLTTGPAGTIYGSDTGLDRDDGFYNRVFITYEWRDETNPDAPVDRRVVTVRSVTTGPYAATVGNTRTLELSRDVRTTQARADAAAAALVKRTVTRGRSFRVTAPGMYWLRPGHTVTLALPLGDPELHLVASVSFDLVRGEMTVTTRLPDGTYTIGA